MNITLHNLSVVGMSMVVFAVLYFLQQSTIEKVLKLGKVTVWRVGLDDIVYTITSIFIISTYLTFTSPWQ